MNTYNRISWSLVSSQTEDRYIYTNIYPESIKLNYECWKVLFYVKFQLQDWFRNGLKNGSGRETQSDTLHPTCAPNSFVNSAKIKVY